MLDHDLFTVLFECAGDRRPRVAGFDEAPAGVADGAATRRVAQQ
jgi:hypothetical protein